MHRLWYPIRFTITIITISHACLPADRDWHRARETLEREQIRAGIQPLAPHLLRRMYATVPSGSAGAGQLLSTCCGCHARDTVSEIGKFRQAKIENLGVTTLGDKNVGWLDVTVNDAFRVSGVESVSNFGGEREQRLQLHRATADAVLERDAFKIFHGDERLPVLLADIVNCADVGMIQCGRGLSFALETSECLRVSGNFLRQEL